MYGSFRFRSASHAGAVLKVVGAGVEPICVDDDVVRGHDAAAVDVAGHDWRFRYFRASGLTR